MPIQPYEPLGVGLIDAIRAGREDQRRQTLTGLEQSQLALAQQAANQRTQAMGQQTADVARQRQAGFLLTKLQTPEGRAKALQWARQTFPDVSQGMSDEALSSHMEQLLQQEAGVAAADSPYSISQQPGPYGSTIVSDSKGKYSVEYDPRKAPPVGGPESFSEFTDAEGKVHLIGNRGHIKDTTLRGSVRVPGGQRPGDTGMKAADSNAIVSAAARAFGGIYDPLTGNVTGLKQADLLNLNRVASRASDIFFQNDGQIPHATAVKQALDEMQGGGQQPAAAAPGSVPPTAPTGRNMPFPSQQAAEAALAGGQLQKGDIVIVNGKPAFRVE